MRFALLLILCAAFPASAQTAAPAPAPAPACSASEYRQFDFWVGDWDVFQTGSSKPVARSLIERLYDGCAVRENWMPLTRPGGGSLNSFTPSDRKWHQVWVDSQGSWVAFSGALAAGSMVLQTEPSDPDESITRMTFSPQDDGSVRQLGEVSKDGGKSWVRSFDFTYRRRDSAGM